MKELDKQNNINKIAGTVLGKQINEYSTKYNPSILVPIARDLNREDFDIDNKFEGVDVWHAYEISFLTEKGLPTTAVGKIVIPANSEYFVESKSLKLYLYSLNMERFGATREEGLQLVQELIQKDLSSALNTNVQVSLHSEITEMNVFDEGVAIEELVDVNSIVFNEFTSNLNILEVEDNNPESKYIKISGIRSNCRVTHQPDFSTLYVKYTSEKSLNLESLMKFAVSFRNENHFHEEVAEYIFQSIKNVLNPSELLVSMLYTRRGGIDICPVRYLKDTPNQDIQKFLDVNTLTQKTLNQ